MATFATVQVYKYLAYNSIMYTEEGLHRCAPIGPNVSGIQSPVLDSWKDVTPKPGQEMSEMELPTPGLTATSAYDPLTSSPFNFIVCKLGTMRGNTEYVYGWVDSVRVKVDKGENRSIIVRWHVDWWHTMGHYAVSSIMYGRGRVLRGPADYARPDPSQPRLWVADAGSSYDIKLSSDTKGPWLVIMISDNYTVGSDTFTEYKICFSGVNEGTYDAGGNTYNPISINKVYYGLFEEILSVQTSQILGVWYSPIPPMDPDSSQPGASIVGGTYYYWHVMQPGTDTTQYTITLENDDICTDDDKKYLITDPIGTVYGTMPWHLGFSKILASVDVGTAGAWLMLRFADKNGNAPQGEGRTVQIPLISAPVSSNEASDYVYSGQEAYDRDLARLQQDFNMKSGIANAGTSAIGGALTGALVGGPAGAIAGLIGGTASSLIGTGVTYGLQGELDSNKMALTKTLLSNQASNVLIQGGSDVWYKCMHGTWNVICMKRDSVSASELSTEQSEFGYVTDIFDGCHSILMTLLGGTYVYKTGGFRIEGLQIYNISKEARDYISGLFARGVHID